ncbi:hypothetical protein FKM82_028120 [Ascaphus truei]
MAKTEVWRAEKNRDLDKYCSLQAVFRKVSESAGCSRMNSLKDILQYILYNLTLSSISAVVF